MIYEVGRTWKNIKGRVLNASRFKGAVGRGRGVKERLLVLNVGQEIMGVLLGTISGVITTQMFM